MRVYVRIRKSLSVTLDSAFPTFSIRPDIALTYDKAMPVTYNNNNARAVLAAAYTPGTLSGNQGLAGVPNTALGLFACTLQSVINFQLLNAQVRASISHKADSVAGASLVDPSEFFFTGPFTQDNNSFKPPYLLTPSLSMVDANDEYFSFPRSRSAYASTGVIDQPTSIDSSEYLRLGTFPTVTGLKTILSKDTNIIGPESQSSPTILSMANPTGIANGLLAGTAPALPLSGYQAFSFVDSLLEIEVNNQSLDAGPSSTAPVFLCFGIPNFNAEYEAVTNISPLFIKGSYLAGGQLFYVNLKLLNGVETLNVATSGNITSTNALITDSEMDYTVSFSLSPFSGF